MPVFVYKGTNAAGAAVSGERAAVNKQALQATLRRERITPASIKVKSKGKGLSFEFFNLGGGVAPRDLGIFTRQFSVMIDAGLPLVQCLEILGSQQENPNFKKALLTVRAKVESGSTLANALREHPKVFDSLYVNLVEAGETGGILDGILQRLALHIEKEVKLKAAIKSAMIYPISVFSIMTLVVGGLLWKVVPTFTQLFLGLGAELPPPTKFVIFLSDSLVNYGPFLIVGGIAFFFLMRSYYATPAGRYALDSLMLNVPVIGMLLRKVAVARFTTTLGTLIASGVPILEGLNITARSSGNAVIERALLKVRKAVEEGRTLVEPLRETKVFPSIVAQMIGVGEQTGALDDMLQKVGVFYEEEVDQAVKDLLTMMEPIILAVLGVIVGGIVISMYMPMFSLIAQLSG